MWWISSAFLLSATVALSAPGVMYDGTAFPEETADGWVHVNQVNQAQRWIEAGWLVQAPVLLPCPPDCTTQDFYEHTLDGQSGANGWRLRWKMESDGPLAIGAVAPSGIAVSAATGVLYHFTIGRDQVAFLRDAFIPLVVTDIDVGAHVYSLELHNDVDPPTFAFRIDGVMIDSGTAEGIFPTQDSLLVFGASAAIVDSVTRWDFVEFGPLPGDPIPAVSTWGVVVFALAILTGGTVLFRRRAETRRLTYVCAGSG